MTFMTWNCRGGGSRTFPNLVRDLRMRHDIDVLVLFEPLSRLSFSDSYKVNARVFSGGIWVLWNNASVQVEVLQSYTQLVHMRIGMANMVPWYFTAIYGSPQMQIRQDLWRDLRQIALGCNGPWLAVGDFNAYLYEHEKNGGACPNR